jgi:7-cyano-7-deazaguanine synthase
MAAAIALLSGGLDSGVAVALWLARGGTIPLCLTADYGQRAAAREREAAAGLARRFGLAWHLLSLPWLGEAAARASSALVAAGGALPRRTAAAPGDAASAAAVWVPARNVVLVAAAAAFADALAAGGVLAGFNREEAATFADNSAAFAAAMDGALRLGTRHDVRVVSPTLELDKRQIVAAARAAGLGPRDFWSCYAEGPAPCGVCESCARSARAWGSPA